MIPFSLRFDDGFFVLVFRAKLLLRLGFGGSYVHIVVVVGGVAYVLSPFTRRKLTDNNTYRCDKKM